MEAVLEFAKRTGIYPVAIYRTFSHDPETDKHKFRIVFKGQVHQPIMVLKLWFTKLMMLLRGRVKLKQVQNQHVLDHIMKKDSVKDGQVIPGGQRLPEVGIKTSGGIKASRYIS